MYLYRITLESLGTTAEPKVLGDASTQFQVPNHDDLFKIIESVRSKELLDANKSAALAIGLKLFSEIVLENRHDPLFAPLVDPLRSFIQALKAVQAPGAVEHDRTLVNNHS